MKNIFRNIAIASVVATGLAVTSCEDMMTIDMGDKTYQNAQDTLYSYLGIMRTMQDIAERQVILGEIRGDLVTSSDYTTDTLFAISNFDNPQDQSCSMLNVRDYYNVINNCNFYIHHADTSAVRANNPDPYMLNEYAQVKAIRAWAYLQLVKNYHAVPFITEPVNSLDVIENFDYNANLVTKDNLVDRLVEDGLAKYVDRPYPQYGNPSDAGKQWGIWETGASSVNISARLCFIPIRVVLGDLYLLRGASGDYERAARYYYDYLKGETTPMATQYVTASFYGGSLLTKNPTGDWGAWAKSYNYTESTNEVISLIPSASNAGFGKMLTRVADIYGYTPSSSQDPGKSSGDASAEGEEENTASGTISVTATYKRQYGPSNAMRDIVNQQTYIDYKVSGGNFEPSFEENEDARYYQSVNETYDDEGEAYALCSKAARGSEFYYTIPTYRKTLIWLRLAEAINRSGYPEFAFAILKEGLNRYTLPGYGEKKYPVPAEGDEVRPDMFLIEEVDGVKYHVKVGPGTGGNKTIVYVVADEGELPNNENDRYEYKDGTLTPYVNPLGQYRPITGSSWVWEMATYRDIVHTGQYQPLYYVTDTLKLNAFNEFLDFSGDVWNNTYGIHAKGSGGFVSNAGQQYRMTTISGTFDQGRYDYGTMLKKHGVDPSNATLNDTINAVENIIVDELALETAFEGNRFTDLVRIAEHKNASGYDGTEWLAQKIANRNSKAATAANPAIDGFNQQIYDKLKNPRNWYFELPKWSTK